MGYTDVRSETAVTDIATFSAWLVSGGTPLCVYHVGNLAGAIGGVTLRNAQMRELARGVWNAAVKRHLISPTKVGPMMGRCMPFGFGGTTALWKRHFT